MIPKDWVPPPHWISSPPFPEFTVFELKILSFIAGHQRGAQAELLVRQIEAAAVTERFNTIHGFFTYVKIDRQQCPPVDFGILGADCQIAEFKPGLGILLFFEDGYLDNIEGFGYGMDDFEGRDLADIRLLSAEISDPLPD